MQETRAAALYPRRRYLHSYLLSLKKEQKLHHSSEGGKVYTHERIDREQSRHPTVMKVLIQSYRAALQRLVTCISSCRTVYGSRCWGPTEQSEGHCLPIYGMGAMALACKCKVTRLSSSPRAGQDGSGHMRGRLYSRTEVPACQRASETIKGKVGGRAKTVDKSSMAVSNVDCGIEQAVRTAQAQHLHYHHHTPSTNFCILIFDGSDHFQFSLSTSKTATLTSIPSRSTLLLPTAQYEHLQVTRYVKGSAPRSRTPRLTRALADLSHLFSILILLQKMRQSGVRPRSNSIPLPCCAY